MPLLVVQELTVSWSKLSRSTPGATIRNRVPLTARITWPEPLRDDFTVLLHQMTFSETEHFEKSNEQLQLVGASSHLHLGCVEIRPDPGQTLATYRYDMTAGAPNRWPQPRTKRLLTGQWGRICYNGRFASGWNAERRYQKRVVNVGLFERFSAEAFTELPPSFVLDDLALLI